MAGLEVRLNTANSITQLASYDPLPPRPQNHHRSGRFSGNGCAEPYIRHDAAMVPSETTHEGTVID